MARVCSPTAEELWAVWAASGALQLLAERIVHALVLLQLLLGEGSNVPDLLYLLLQQLRWRDAPLAQPAQVHSRQLSPEDTIALNLPSNDILIHLHQLL